jgi:hypothetical protein
VGESIQADAVIGIRRKYGSSSEVLERYTRSQADVVSTDIFIPVEWAYKRKKGRRKDQESGPKDVLVAMVGDAILKR